MMRRTFASSEISVATTSGDYHSSTHLVGWPVCLESSFTSFPRDSCRVEATADHVHVSPHSKPVGPDIDVIGVAEDNAHETVAGRDAGVLKNDSSATNFVPVKLSKV